MTTPQGETDGKVREALAKNPVFQVLDEESRRALAGRAILVALRPKEVLWPWAGGGRQGDGAGGAEDRPRGVAVVVEGHLQVARTVHRKGRAETRVLRVLEPGDAAGFSVLAGEPHTASLIAADETQVAVLCTEDMVALIRRHPDLALRIIGHLGHLVGLLTDEKLEVKTSDLETRLVRWLRRIVGRGGRVRITHQELAGHVLGTRANVTRALDRLQRRGALRLGRGWIEVLDLGDGGGGGVPGGEDPGAHGPS